MASTETVQALVLHGAKDLRLETRPPPVLQHGDVQIAVKATGICGSDLHYFNLGRNGNFVVQSPLVLGHEASGVVTAVPDATNGDKTADVASPNLRVGDRVALEVGFPCRSCTQCSTGRYNLCSRLSFRSSAKTFPHTDGTLQTVISQPANMCHKLPENVTFEQGALVEPLAVSLHALNRSQSAGSGVGVPLVGSTALVLGAGAVGMLTAAALSVAGVSEIVIADIDAPRLKIAATLGGGKFKLKTFLLPRKSPASTISETLAEVQEQAAEICKSVGVEAGFDRVFECTGVPSCVQMGIYAATAGGKLILVGMGTPIQTLPLGAAALREVDIIGVFRYANCYPAAIALFASGQLDGVAEDLVSHRVALADGEKAFRIATNQGREGEDEGRVPVKVVITS
ncbi:L-iditol 2-dehydrogenase [Cladophialophora psammophila CBS 110553]|uniref:L-iditol 2-dehydrogenase n=1 Tax=Cladophialophora psammophila CBS 110553 TaxID=1182543 RepID=W9WU16_9EURO|nr:L-iditol 2-dehydrogenase [Cladophialophora psammophila CBS 110553]EXJ68520.1 L-iditol 2-dehydrogenase [Cladophialophora psammophila CBS 110553]